MDRRQLGSIGEKLAAKLLKKKGYTIRDTNYRSRRGEIDIIATQSGYTVFIEVRTKSNLDYGLPEESITHFKKQKLINLAFAYLNEHPNMPQNWRIDMVAVELGENNKPTRIELIENITG